MGMLAHPNFKVSSKLNNLNDLDDIHIGYFTIINNDLLNTINELSWQTACISKYYKKSKDKTSIAEYLEFLRNYPLNYKFLIGNITHGDFSIIHQLDEDTLWIDCAYAQKLSSIPDYIDSWVYLANTIGVKQLQWMSGRSGWQRAMNKQKMNFTLDEETGVFTLIL